MRNQKIAQILQNDHTDIRILTDYISTLEQLNSTLITEHFELLQDLDELRTENATLRAEHN